ncbi:MAG: hypothetical protein K9L59_09375 [Desulfobacterales bacterium]|nr:hypothetical protein [Desulfobacterales bacterium]MCF8080382.1 hypothetical protein [Desulfobacterales bacterium]
METIAVYWEPKIKTYGIAEKTGLSMVSFYLLTEELERGEGRLRRAGSAAGELLLVFARPSAQGGLRLHLLFEGRPTWHLLEEFSGATGGGHPSGLRVDADVELIYFQGPHFGDRYGIADAAFGALLGADIPVLAAACTGASIYIVLPKDTAAAARKALSEKFIVPGT